MLVVVSLQADFGHVRGGSGETFVSSAHRDAACRPRRVHRHTSSGRPRLRHAEAPSPSHARHAPAPTPAQCPPSSPDPPTPPSPPRPPRTSSSTPPHGATSPSTSTSPPPGHSTCPLLLLPPCPTRQPRPPPHLPHQAPVCFNPEPRSRQPPDQIQSPHLLSPSFRASIVQSRLPNQSTLTGRAADRRLKAPPLYLRRTIPLSPPQNQSLLMTGQRLVLPVCLFLIRT